MDRYTTRNGTIDLSVLGHASVLIHWNERIILVDPYSEVYDFSQLPTADLILVTHHHHDHYDPKALKNVFGEETTLLSTEEVARKEPRARVLRNGDHTTWEGLTIRAVPAYNIENMRSPGEPYHIPGEGNGYLIEIGEVCIYIAGDTEWIPEMHDLPKIDIALLPKNLPYTMSDEKFVEAARCIAPRFLYPYHYFDIDRSALKRELPGITIR